MKRDWELVRRILNTIEELDSHLHQVSSNDFLDYDEKIVWQHIYLLEQAGLVKAQCIQPLSGARSCSATELTWEGHEFLDKIRSERIWSKTKKSVKEKGLELSFEVIKAAATGVIAKMLI